MRRLLPKSINFIGYDIETFARACPNLQELKLGPLFRADPCTIRASEVDSRAASTISTALSTDSLSLSLSVPVNARKAGASVSDCQSNSSDTIRCLHADLSWINDLLHVYILLSHLTPYFDNLRWFHHITKTDRASLSRTLMRVGDSCNQPSARKKCVDSSSARKKCVNSGKRHNRFFSEGYKWVKTDRISYYEDENEVHAPLAPLPDEPEVVEDEEEEETQPVVGEKAQAEVVETGENMTTESSMDFDLSGLGPDGLARADVQGLSYRRRT
ncbi:hypothetical protein HHX47_DHR2000533 [Lentinula edodes]|nr:hypothetical protein HHX47_DHR2000533 [Lentinula edodes]